jgi:hypothetical protein
MSISPSLSLFGVVLEADDPISTYGTTFLGEYGVVVHVSASDSVSIIKRWLDTESLDGNQLNSSFHKSWQKVTQASMIQLVTEQIFHYFSTYGLESLGVYNDSLIYIPAEVLELPDKLPIKVIYGVSRQEILDRCFSLLASGIALKQETIALIFEVFDELSYVFTGDEAIANREAQLYVIDRSDKLPNDAMTMFRYFVYKATEQTLLIKSKDLIEKIKASKYVLPKLSTTQLTALAEHFNRLKPLWLAFKVNNAAIVNRVAKLSKKAHKPLPMNVMSNVSAFSLPKISATVCKANIFQLVRAYNSIEVALRGSNDRFYLVRNGKGYAKKNLQIVHENEYGVESLQVAVLKSRSRILYEEILNRFTNKKIYIPENVDYAIPSSEKQFTGFVPYNTKICIPSSQEFGLAGIYWEGNVDLDLRADAVGDSVGWNANYRSGVTLDSKSFSKSFKGVGHSGDVTSAPNGATEYLYYNEIRSPYSIKNSLFSGEIGQSFKLIIGGGNDITKNYVIDPAKVLFTASMTMIQKEMTIGVLVPAEQGANFYLLSSGSGNLRVGRDNEVSQIARQAMMDKALHSLRLSNLIKPEQLALTPQEADIDLSGDRLAKDSFFNLFS